MGPTRLGARSLGLIRPAPHRKNPDRPGHPLLELQRTAGNQAVQRLLGDVDELLANDPSADQASSVDTAPAPATADPVVGLKVNDGMTTETVGLRSRVQELQRLLNQAMITNLKIDGKFGPLTQAAVHDFQTGTDLSVTDEVDQFTAQHLRTGGGGRTVGPSGPVATDPDPVEKQRADDEEEAGNALSRAGDAQRAGLNVLGDAGRSLPYGSGNPSLGIACHHLNMAVDGMNQGTYAIWEDAKIRRNHRTGAGSPGGNALVGLRKGDGMTAATVDRRDRVKLLQTRLNSEGNAGLNPDGKFGDNTSFALEMFSEAKLGQPSGGVIGSDLADMLMGRQPDAGGPYSERGLGRAAHSFPLLADWMATTAERHTSAAAGTGNAVLADGLRRAGAEFAKAVTELKAVGAKLSSFPDGLTRPAEARPVSPSLAKATGAFDKAADYDKQGAGLERKAGDEMDERAVGSAVSDASDIWDYQGGHWRAIGSPLSRV